MNENITLVMTITAAGRSRRCEKEPGEFGGEPWPSCGVLMRRFNLMLLESAPRLFLCLSLSPAFGKRRRSPLLADVSGIERWGTLATGEIRMPVIDLTFDEDRAVERLLRFLSVEGITGQEQAIAAEVTRALREVGVPAEA